MNTREIFAQIDGLFRVGEYDRALLYMEGVVRDALAAGENAVALSVLNELMGSYRHIKNMERAWACADKILELIDILELGSSPDAATSLLNIATVYKTDEKYEKALEIYLKIGGIFRQHGIEDIRAVGLYNNICVTSLDLDRVDAAIEYGTKAMELAVKVGIPEKQMNVTKNNLAAAIRRQKVETL